VFVLGLKHSDDNTQNGSMTTQQQGIKNGGKATYNNHNIAN